MLSTWYRNIVSNPSRQPRFNIRQECGLLNVRYFTSATIASPITLIFEMVTSTDDKGVGLTYPGPGIFMGARYVNWKTNKKKKGILRKYWKIRASIECIIKNVYLM